MNLKQYCILVCISLICMNSYKSFARPSQAKGAAALHSRQTQEQAHTTQKKALGAATIHHNEQLQAASTTAATNAATAALTNQSTNAPQSQAINQPAIQQTAIPQNQNINPSNVPQQNQPITQNQVPADHTQEPTIPTEPKPIENVPPVNEEQQPIPDKDAILKKLESLDDYETHANLLLTQDSVGQLFNNFVEFKNFIVTRFAKQDMIDLCMQILNQIYPKDTETMSTSTASSKESEVSSSSSTKPNK